MVETCHFALRPLGVVTPSAMSAIAICRADFPPAMPVMMRRRIGAVDGSGTRRSFVAGSDHW